MITNAQPTIAYGTQRPNFAIPKAFSADSGENKTSLHAVDMPETLRRTPPLYDLVITAMVIQVRS